jgi:hypothetical protein
METEIDRLDVNCSRMCVVYQVMNMLVYFEPAAMCDKQTDLILAPLPSEKQLWEASDEFLWRAANERGSWAHNVFGLATNGELVKLDVDRTYCRDALLLHKSAGADVPTRNAANWEEWCSGMDSFGGLVMLAASLTA